MRSRSAVETTDSSKTLAYCMRNGVTYSLQNNAPVLVLSYPLKAIKLSAFWKPVFDSLNVAKSYTSFEEIISLTGSIDPEKTEMFLNKLVSKGFLEYEGFLNQKHYPSVSIIIPVRNRPAEVSACLQSLMCIDYPMDKMEVIVVDDASEDDTPDEVSRFPVKLITLKEHKHASYCRNEAARIAGGDILAFLDSDCIADKMWLKELLPAFKDESVAAVGGFVDSYHEDKAIDKYEKVKSSLRIGKWFKRSDNRDNFFYVPSCNLLVRQAIFMKVNGFRQHLHVGEDVDFCWRIRDCGYNLVYWPKGLIYHRHRNRLSAFARRRFDYGTSEPLLQQLHADRVKKFVCPPAETFSWCIAMLAIVLGFPFLFVLTGFSFLFVIVFKFFETRRMGLPIGLRAVSVAVFRSFLTFPYQVCAFVSRYYLGLAFLIFPYAMWVSKIIFGMHIAAGCVEYFSKKPNMNVVSFIFYYTIEQVSYQFGVWWGCLKEFYFHPVNPRIVIGPIFWKRR